MEESSSEEVSSSVEESSSEEEYPEENYTEGLIFTLQDDDTYAVTDYTGTATEVVIPSEYDGKAVTRIGEEAFNQCYNLTEIVIPDSVTSIGKGTFQYCYNLTEIIIPDSATRIGESVFYECSSLTIYCEAESKSRYWNVDWNDSNCPVVWNCKNSDVATDGYIYIIVDGVRYGLKESVATVVRQPRNIAIARIAETITYKDAMYAVKSIGEVAFKYCYSLKSVTFGENSQLTGIGNGAFDYCSGLTGIVIPDSVTSIGDEAFIYCYSLKSVMFGESSQLRKIGESAFRSCYLTEIVIPNGVGSIGESAFYDCSSLTEIIIPDSVYSIGRRAFAYCSKLTKIAIPDSVWTMGMKVFEDCSNLTIYCEAKSQPSGWNSMWNYSNHDYSYCPVVWGYKGE